MELTRPQKRVLLELNGLDEPGEIGLSELAQLLGWDGVTVQKTVERLYYSNLVTRSTVRKRGGTNFASYEDPWVSLTWLGRDQLQRALERDRRAAQAATRVPQAKPGWWRSQWSRGLTRVDVWVAVVFFVVLVCALTEWAW